jgi:hypothetical protein
MEWPEAKPAQEGGKAGKPSSIFSPSLPSVKGKAGPAWLSGRMVLLRETVHGMSSDAGIPRLSPVLTDNPEPLGGV